MAHLVNLGHNSLCGLECWPDSGPGPHCGGIGHKGGGGGDPGLSGVGKVAWRAWGAQSSPPPPRVPGRPRAPSAPHSPSHTEKAFKVSWTGKTPQRGTDIHTDQEGAVESRGLLCKEEDLHSLPILYIYS